MTREIVFRHARVSDVQEIAELERRVWREEGADEAKIVSRIATFSQGSIVVATGDAILGYTVFELVGDVREAPCFSWSEITDSGMIQKSHNPGGDFAYGLNLTVDQRVSGLSLGSALVMHVLAALIEDNKRGIFLGSRMPGFARYKERYPKTTADEYVFLRWKGKLRDPELRFYEGDGFVVEKVLPNYFPDEKSLNFGALLLWANPYLDREDRGAIALKMRTEACEMIEESKRRKGSEC